MLIPIGDMLPSTRHWNEYLGVSDYFVPRLACQTPIDEVPVPVFVLDSLSKAGKQSSMSGR